MASPFCFLCASDEGVFLDITIENKQTFQQQFDICSLKKVPTANQLPTKICHKCAYELKHCSIFIQKYKRTIKHRTKFRAKQTCSLCFQQPRKEYIFDLKNENSSQCNSLNKIQKVFNEEVKKDEEYQFICLSCRYTVDVLCDLKNLSQEIASKLDDIINREIDYLNFPKVRTTVISRKTTITESARVALKTTEDIDNDTKKMTRKRSKNKVINNKLTNKVSIKSTEELCEECHKSNKTHIIEKTGQTVCKSCWEIKSSVAKEVETPQTLVETKVCKVFLKDVLSQVASKTQKLYEIEEDEQGRKKYRVTEKEVDGQGRKQYIVTEKEDVEQSRRKHKVTEKENDEQGTKKQKVTEKEDDKQSREKLKVTEKEDDEQDKKKHEVTEKEDDEQSRKKQKVTEKEDDEQSRKKQKVTEKEDDEQGKKKHKVTEKEEDKSLKESTDVESESGKHPIAKVNTESTENTDKPNKKQESNMKEEIEESKSVSLTESTTQRLTRSRKPNTLNTSHSSDSDSTILSNVKESVTPLTRHKRATNSSLSDTDVDNKRERKRLKSILAGNTALKGFNISCESSSTDDAAPKKKRLRFTSESPVMIDVTNTKNVDERLRRNSSAENPSTEKKIVKSALVKKPQRIVQSSSESEDNKFADDKSETYSCKECGVNYNNKLIFLTHELTHCKQPRLKLQKVIVKSTAKEVSDVSEAVINQREEQSESVEITVNDGEDEKATENSNLDVSSHKDLSSCETVQDTIKVEDSTKGSSTDQNETTEKPNKRRKIVRRQGNKKQDKEHGKEEESESKITEVVKETKEVEKENETNDQVSVHLKKKIVTASEETSSEPKPSRDISNEVVDEDKSDSCKKASENEPESTDKLDSSEKPEENEVQDTDKLDSSETHEENKIEGKDAESEKVVQIDEDSSGSVEEVTEKIESDDDVQCTEIDSGKYKKVESDDKIQRTQIDDVKTEKLESDDDEVQCKQSAGDMTENIEFDDDVDEVQCTEIDSGKSEKSSLHNVVEIAKKCSTNGDSNEIIDDDVEMNAPPEQVEPITDSADVAAEVLQEVLDLANAEVQKRQDVDASSNGNNLEEAETLENISREIESSGDTHLDELEASPAVSS
ncbi:PREDICTED: uncharacterized protein DDB_G0283697-like [Dufourea novaeangliae]|uniref:uncharacterized protein DDB_G0283697-like n=1 Tax=Dufourea novaeangliae TaxID=178035 RepID=UPI0007672E37|nr:PREDICTED: uncharacterized protein DDB_G0283697-like [Dufourea novaeangliae]